MGCFYPTFVTDRLVDTINFYEDNFGFVPKVENLDYVLMEKQGQPAICLAVAGPGYKSRLEEAMAPVSGLILNMPVQDLGEAYDFFYMEGLEIVRGIGTDEAGRRSFVLADPNGVLINVIESEYNPAEGCV